jgi:hypothetical protein
MKCGSLPVRSLSLFSCGLILLVAVACLTASEPAGAVAFDPAIAPYVKFLKDHPVDAKKYILDLYKTNDVVVLAERDHQETTQWDFIFDLTRDPEFTARVGYLFTEYGSVDQQADMDAFLRTETADDKRIIALLRDFVIWPSGWDNNNLFEFIRKFHAWNRSQSPERRLTWCFCDIPWNWPGLTKAEYKSRLDLAQAGRDEIMALRIRYKLEEIRASAVPRKKALVIVNTRHAFKVPLKKGDVFYYENLGSALARWQPTAGRTAYVMMHYVHGVRPGSDGLSKAPIHDGKWDAAFAACGNLQTAVSFHDSPFGQDSFDYLGFAPMQMRYRDVFDGMIFDCPLERHRLHNDIPGFYDDVFRAKVLERAQLNGSVDEIKALFRERQEHPERFQARPAYDPRELQPIARWLTKR